LDRLVSKEDVDNIETWSSRVIRHTTPTISAVTTLYVGFTGALYRQAQTSQAYKHADTAGYTSSTNE